MSNSKMTLTISTETDERIFCWTAAVTNEFQVSRTKVFPPKKTRLDFWIHFQSCFSSFSPLLFFYQERGFLVHTSIYLFWRKPFFLTLPLWWKLEKSVRSTNYLSIVDYCSSRGKFFVCFPMPKTFVSTAFSCLFSLNYWSNWQCSRGSRR